VNAQWCVGVPRTLNGVQCLGRGVFFSKHHSDVGGERHVVVLRVALPLFVLARRRVAARPALSFVLRVLFQAVPVLLPFLMALRILLSRPILLASRAAGSLLLSVIFSEKRLDAPYQDMRHRTP